MIMTNNNDGSHLPAMGKATLAQGLKNASVQKPFDKWDSLNYFRDASRTSTEAQGNLLIAHWTGLLEHDLSFSDLARMIKGASILVHTGIVSKTVEAYFKSGSGLHQWLDKVCRQDIAPDPKHLVKIIDAFENFRLVPNQRFVNLYRDEVNFNRFSQRDFIRSIEFFSKSGQVPNTDFMQRWVKSVGEQLSDFGYDTQSRFARAMAICDVASGSQSNGDFKSLAKIFLDQTAGTDLAAEQKSQLNDAALWFGFEDHVHQDFSPAVKNSLWLRNLSKEFTAVAGNSASDDLFVTPLKRELGIRYERDGRDYIIEQNSPHYFNYDSKARCNRPNGSLLLRTALLEKLNPQSVILCSEQLSPGLYRTYGQQAHAVTEKLEALPVGAYKTHMSEKGLSITPLIN